MISFRTFAIALLCAVSATTSTSGQSRPAGGGHLDAAIEAGNWIRSTQVKTAHGIAWPVVPDESQEITRNLYSGSPGVILFFLELGKATGDLSWIDDARHGADDLLGQLPDDLGETNPSLWSGLAGQGFTLHRTYLATKDERYLAGAIKCVDVLKAGAILTEEALPRARWNEVTDIIGGTAGIGLFLLYAANEMDDPEALHLAVKAGNDLMTRAERVEIDNGRHGYKWAMTEEFPRLMPNFSHGTAGICYFLATLHQELKTRDVAVDDRFLEASLAGDAYLNSIADTDHDGFKLFHHEPEGEELYYLGWCHGPVGTSRLFYRLGEITGKIRWSRLLEQSANGVMISGIPKNRPEGFWQNVGPCCGSAGVGSFFLDLSGNSPQQEYIQFALAMGQDIMDHATKVELPDGVKGLKWIQAEHRVRPDFLQAQTGYMQGAAGVGLWLLKLDAYENGRKFDLRFPDSPW